MQNLQRRYDAMTVMLIFYSDGSSDSGPSYQLPNKIETKTSDSHAIMVYSPIVSIISKQFVSKKKSFCWDIQEFWDDAVWNLCWTF